jgi:hypothetical protein
MQVLSFALYRFLSLDDIIVSFLANLVASVKIVSQQRTPCGSNKDSVNLYRVIINDCPISVGVGDVVESAASLLT